MRSIIPTVTRGARRMQLSIEIDSEPIAGSVSVDAGVPEDFCGWIELVAAIESARSAESSGAQESLGVFPGANRGAA